MSRSLALLLVIPIAACRKEAPQAAPEVGPRMSRGFGRAASVPDQPSPGQQKKLDAQERNLQPGAVVLPPETVGRRVPTSARGDAAMDVYVDGALTATVEAGAITDSLLLTEVLRKAAVIEPRSVLIHGEANDLWIPGPDATAFTLRANNRGQIKIEPSAGGMARKRGREAAAAQGPPPPREPRVFEVRGVIWVEVRTASSPRLGGEPGPVARLMNSRGDPLVGGRPGQAGGGGGRGGREGSSGGMRTGSGKGEGGGKGDGSGGGHRRRGAAGR